MRPRGAQVAAGVVVLLGIVLVPAVLAHGNVLAVDSQRTANGTVQLEGVYSLTSSWIVVYEDDGGSRGAVLGHTGVGSGTYLTDVAVPIDRRVWRNWSGARSIHVVMQNEDGDGEFEPDDDPVLTQSDDVVGATITLARADRPGYVAARRFQTATSTGNATVRRVVLPVDGRLVLHAGTLSGQVVAERPLAAGTHTDVTVALDEGFYRYQGSRFTLAAVLYSGGQGDRIDGTTRLMAGREPLATTFRVEPANTTTPTPTPESTTSGGATPTTTAATSGDEHGEGGHDDGGHEHTGDAGHSTTHSGAAGGEETTGTTTGEPSTTSRDATTTVGAGGAGFGVVAGLLAVSLAGLLATRRRW